MNRNKIIDKVIQNSIDSFLSQRGEKNNILPRIDGKIPDVRKYIRTFGTVKHYNNMNEGLIKTYPLDKSIKYIIRKYDLSDEQIKIDSVNYGIMTIDIICLILPNNISKNIIGDIKHDFRTCGYFNSQKPKQIENTNFFVLIFEPKFTQNISDNVRKHCKYLYHSAPKSYLNKIIKKGLIPKSKNSLFFYPDRTFFMVGDKLNTNQLDALKDIQNTRNANIELYSNIEDKEYVLLTIDISKLPNDINFYCDPLAFGAIFTYDNIPPNAIINIEPFTL